MGNTLSTTDPLNHTVTYTYNSRGLLKSTVYPGDNNIGQYTKTYLYDKKMNLVHESDSLNKEVITTLDLQSRPLSVTTKQKNASAGITISSAYDLNGNIVYLTDPNGNVTTSTYDVLNRQISKSITAGTVTHTDTLEYNKDGQVTKQTNRLGNSVISRYDALGRLSEVVDPLGVTVEKLVYDNMGRQISSTDAVNNTITHTYDKNSRLLSTTTPINTSINKTQSQTYDNLGNIATRKDGRNNVTSYTYDRLNRLTVITNPNGSTVSYTYNLNSQVTSQTDGNGNVESFTYNIRGLQSKITDGDGLEQTMSYNPDGTLDTKVDRNGTTTSYTYDAYGRLTQETAGTDTISYEYDSNGNMLKMTDSTGITVRTYDGLNRVLTKTVPELGTTTFVYDITAGLTGGFVAESIATPDGTTTQNIYDKAGRLHQVKDGNTVSATYAYYASGAKQSVTYPGNIIEEYTYYGDLSLHTLTNKQNNIILEAFNYAYDANGNMLTKLDGKGTTTYTYNNMNQLLTVSEATGRALSYTYDGAGNRRTETVTESGVTTVIAAEYNEQNRLVSTSETKSGEMVVTNYSYDNNGNNTAVVDYAKYSVTQGQAPQLIELLAESSNGNTSTYQYDSRNRLIQATDGGATVYNTYNGNGLRVSKSSGAETTHFLYNGSKVILEKDDTSGDYTKNVYGSNQISREDSGGKLYYLYNGHGDVTQLIKNGVSVVSYYYDAFGNLLEEIGSANNPYRYSGYYYDTEVSLYYLQSRYYNPKTARFMQEDTYRGNPASILSLNRYTYCHNNPIIYNDPSGYAAQSVDYTSVRQANESIGNTVTWDAGSGKGNSSIAIDFNGTNASVILRENIDYYIDASGTARYVTGDNKVREPEDIPIIRERDKSNGSSSGSSSSSSGYDYYDGYSSSSYNSPPPIVERPKESGLVIDLNPYVEFDGFPLIASAGKYMPQREYRRTALSSLIYDYGFDYAFYKDFKYELVNDGAGEFYMLLQYKGTSHVLTEGQYRYVNRQMTFDEKEIKEFLNDVVAAKIMEEAKSSKVTKLDLVGHNMIANMERDLNTINYDKNTGLITGIPSTDTDVGYGHDFIKNPMSSVPSSMSASEAYELLKLDAVAFENAIATGINANFTQNQFNALISLRYNVGYLGEVDGLLPYLESGSYDRNSMESIIKSNYDAIINFNPANEIYRVGWYNRTDKMLDIFFDGNYGHMPIDAVNGRVNFK